MSSAFIDGIQSIPELFDLGQAIGPVDVVLLGVLGEIIEQRLNHIIESIESFLKRLGFSRCLLERGLSGFNLCLGLLQYLELFLVND